jgi:hypothetical protein
MTKPTDAQILEAIRPDARRIADQALERANGDVRIALALLGIAVDHVVKAAEPSLRTKILDHWLSAFRPHGSAFR